ncbi:MAG: hypothetical protein EOP58_01720 [Sphingomonadales bacterium]|nr:MAG: hypothetical protein EOP58_01720 [Sphingomonadales bacterium]
MSVDLALAKQHLRVTHSNEDTIIAAYLAAAKAWVERYTGKGLTDAERVETLPAFPVGDISLAWGPYTADSLTITYLDSDLAEQTFTDFTVLSAFGATRVRADDVWPTAESVTLTYDAGYTSTPADLDAAVLLLTGEYYDNREAGTASSAASMAVESLCHPHRSVRV